MVVVKECSNVRYNAYICKHFAFMWKYPLPLHILLLHKSITWATAWPQLSYCSMTTSKSVFKGILTLRLAPFSLRTDYEADPADSQRGTERFSRKKLAAVISFQWSYISTGRDWNARYIKMIVLNIILIPSWKDNVLDLRMFCYGDRSHKRQCFSGVASLCH